MNKRTVAFVFLLFAIVGAYFMTWGWEGPSTFRMASAGALGVMCLIVLYLQHRFGREKK